MPSHLKHDNQANFLMTSDGKTSPRVKIAPKRSNRPTVFLPSFIQLVTFIVSFIMSHQPINPTKTLVLSVTAESFKLDALLFCTAKRTGSTTSFTLQGHLLDLQLVESHIRRQFRHVEAEYRDAIPTLSDADPSRDEINTIPLGPPPPYIPVASVMANRSFRDVPAGGIGVRASARTWRNVVPSFIRAAAGMMDRVVIGPVAPTPQFVHQQETLHGVHARSESDKRGERESLEGDEQSVPNGSGPSNSAPTTTENIRQPCPLGRDLCKDRK
ncbi:hypothetical protein DFS34DRAFT_588584 [Phlyctochytrium arcticum]|nr:hypothetical protein DFS34DRAFT_588584 [Phlyctochytrium arcticum]